MKIPKGKKIKVTGYAKVLRAGDTVPEKLVAKVEKILSKEKKPTPSPSGTPGGKKD